MPETPDFFEKNREKEEITEPEEEDERWRLSKMYGEDAKGALLKKGEAMRKKKAKQEEIRGHLRNLRRKLDIHRSGDQEEFGFKEEK